MAFTNGTMMGQFSGATVQGAFNSSNPTNPNAAPPHALVSFVNPGEVPLLYVTATGTVVTNPGKGTGFIGSQLGTLKMDTQQFSVLATSPSASQICQAMFPQNTQQLDIFQIIAPGSGAVVFRLLYNGTTATS